MTQEKQLHAETIFFSTTMIHINVYIFRYTNASFKYVQFKIDLYVLLMIRLFILLEIVYI